MFSTRASPTLVGQRLDPGFYDPRYVADEIKLSKFPRDTLDSVRDPSARISYGVIKPAFVQSDCAMVRIQDFEDPFVDLEQAARIDPAQARAFARSACRTGDLLIAIGGYPGRLGIVGAMPAGINTITVNQHVVRLRPAPAKATPYFLAAVFLTTYGFRLLARQVSGSVQAGVNVEDLRDIAIPRFAAAAEDYVGSKVRQAESLRERGRSSLASAQRELEDRLRVDGLPFDARRSNRVPPSAVSGEKLSGEYYLPRYFNLERHLKVHSHRTALIGDLLREPVGRASTPLETVDSGTACILTSDIDPHQIRWREPSMWMRDIDAGSHAGRLQEHDVVYSSVGPPVGEAAVILRHHLPMHIGSDVSVLRTGPALHPGYLSLFLNSVFGQRQNDRFARGIRQRRVYAEDIEAFIIGVPDDESQVRIGEQVIAYELRHDFAGLLTNAARLFIEALIERKVTEAELIAASKDPAADRALLSRLAEDGLDGTGRRLFSDLDALDLLLTEARPLQ